MSYETIISTILFKGKVFDVRRDEVRAPDGKVHTLDVVVHHGAVTLVPVDEAGQIWFIRQYRHPARDWLLELPAGVMEEGEDPEITARREIREEVSMAAQTLRPLGEFYLAPGYSSEYMHVFLATGLSEDPLPGDEDESIEVVKLSPQAAMQAAQEGKIKDAKSLLAFFLARPFLKL